MATREFIEKRIEGKEKEITKLEKKLERIKKAEASHWENNPHYYQESDLKWTAKYIEDAKADLKKYQDQLSLEEQKSNSRNIPAITEFLEKWYERSVEYFLEEHKLYLEALKVYRDKMGEYADWHNNGSWRLPKEERQAVEKERRDYEKQFKSDWSHVTQFDHGDLDWEATMKKDLKQEMIRKYDFIVERTCQIVGTITDATNLDIGLSGELNGYIIGTEGKASVNTIGAGGYNIQCFHFRTLINRF